MSCLLELADKEFLGIRNFLDEYQNAIKIKMKESVDNQNILLDKVSLYEFIKSEYFESVLQEITNKTGWMGYTLVDTSLYNEML